VVQTTVVLVVTIGLELAGPQVLRRFIDAAMGGAPDEVLLALAAVFIALALVDQVLVGFGAYAGEDLSWRATNALRADLVRHCLDLDLAFHDHHTPGELIERIDGDVTALSSFFSAFVLYILWGVFLALGILVVLWREDWRVGLALTVFCAVALAVLHRVRNLATPAWTADRESAAHLFGFLEERLAGLTDLHANGAQAYVLRRFHELARLRFWRHRRAMVLGGVTFSATGGLFLLGYVLAFALGAALFAAGAVTLGTVYLIFHYTQMLRLPLELLSRQVQDFQKAAAGIARIDALTRLRPAIPPTPAVPASDRSGPALPPGPLAVAFRGVTFGYTQEGGDGAPAPVLRDVSFAVPAGRTLGVLGRTGSGKTTLSRLLFRFYDPQAGSVSLAGTDLRALPPAVVRRHIGLVTQEVQLFRATVRDNLTLFDPRVPEERLLETVDRLGLGGWLRGLPAGLDTPIAGGRGLSAGEAQLLALGRVFLQGPGLVVLDEASSRLDPATERRVQRAVDRLLGRADGGGEGAPSGTAGERTGIVIAHRLATLERVDDVLILEGGRVVEWGPRLVLAGDPASRFARLLRAGELKAVLA
jgi:ABC-type multidrug transport system fused ATPase/permease subunit